MLLSELVDGLAIRGALPAGLTVDAITIDEREVRPGTLYMARRGYYGDGHDRIGAAIAAGATALLVRDPARVPRAATLPVLVHDEDDELLGRLSSRFYGEPTRSLVVYGVTGTNGKTSVSYLLEHILTALGERPAVVGTVSYRLGAHSYPACNTTPDALFVHRFAHQALAAGARSMVLEVSSHALSLGRTAAVHFSRVGFTNLSRDHLDFHGTMADYQRAKQRLFTEGLVSSLAARSAPLAAACVTSPIGWQMLRATVAGVTRLAVRVVASPDTPAGHRGAESVPSENVGPGEMAHLALEVTEPLGLLGFRFRVRTERWTSDGRTTLLGRHNLENIALAVGLAAGNDADRARVAVQSIASFRGVPGRMEAAAPVERGGPAVFVDYAHTPEAVERALAAFDEVGARPVTIVLGCGGDRDRGKRGPMATAAACGAERVILTADNPRSEEPGAIVAQMREAIEAMGPVRRAQQVIEQLDRAAAIEQAVAAAGHGPVLIAGKGHERYQERLGVRHAFDDCEHARRALVGLEIGQSGCTVPLWCGWSAERIASLSGAVPASDTARCTASPWLELRFVPAPSATAPEAASRTVTLRVSTPMREGGATPAHAVGTFVAADPRGSVAALARGILAEASVSVAGLWVAAVVARGGASDAVDVGGLDCDAGLPWPPARPLGDVIADVVGPGAAALVTARCDEACRVVRPAERTGASVAERWNQAVVQVAGLTYADRGLLLVAPPQPDLHGDSDPAAALAGLPPWLDPAFVIASSDPHGLAASGFGRPGWLDDARAVGRRRFGESLPPRPIPVPVELTLDAGCGAQRSP